MNLSVYLKELLKTNDCVIIPDLGGFIANYQSAAFNAQGDQFYPPAKEIIFSGKLKKNDGLLVNHICEREGIGYMEARKIVAEFVAECMFKLENGEQVEFAEIGTLRFDQNEHFQFEADPHGSLRTDVFGLDSFHFPQLINKYNQPPKPVFRDKDPEPQKQRRPAVKYLLLALPILAALYFIPKIIGQDPVNQQQSSNTASLLITDAPAPINSAVVAVPSTVSSEPKSEAKVSGKGVKEKIQLSEPAIVPDHAPVITKAAASKASEPEKTIVLTSVNKSSTGKFHVVGGCFKVRENADKLAEKLIKQGYNAQVSNLGKSFFRVSIESFQTRKEAEQALIKLLNAEPDASYWLMADKK